ncbi:MAG: glycoside hydrolase 43 family protein [Chitinophagaceae bacterium]
MTASKKYVQKFLSHFQSKVVLPLSARRGVGVRPFFAPIHYRIWACLTINFLIFSTSLFSQTTDTTHTWGNWQKWGDQGNGTYANPILPGDYSDLDCIRAGKIYYAVSSTFQFSPGFVILQSTDLVNWDIIGHVVDDITRISPEMNWDKMNRYGKGIWAGAIRFHDHKFWVYFGTPDEGYFMSTATDPAGPWSPLDTVLNEKGWDDCCPFWDDNGQGWLVGTNFSDGYKIHLFKLSSDGKKLLKESDKVIHQSKGSEANKLYKIKGLYYHLFSEVKSEGRVVMMERSKNIYGPYDEAKQLNHAEKQFKEPNQGGLVQSPNGDWYFLTHHGSGDWSGRNMSLLPVTWIDGWPVIGAVGNDGIGRMQWTGKTPLKNVKRSTPKTDDEFNASKLLPQWEWNYQPRKDKWSLGEKPGWLRLYAFQPLETDNILQAGNTLTQRTFRTLRNEVIIKLDLNNMADGQKTGLCHFAAPNYSALCIARKEGSLYLEYNLKGKLTPGASVTGKAIWLKSTWGLEGLGQYFYSLDGESYLPFGEPYQMTWGGYRGDRIGIFNYNNQSENGYVDVDFFHYKYNGKK